MLLLSISSYAEITSWKVIGNLLVKLTSWSYIYTKLCVIYVIQESRKISIINRSQISYKCVFQNLNERFQKGGPGQTCQNAMPDLDPNCLTLMVFLKEYFKKK